MGLSSRGRKRTSPVVANRLHRRRKTPSDLMEILESRRTPLSVEQTAEADLRRARRHTGWQDAAVAWSVCASIHREYAKGKDPFYKTRQRDYTRHENAARTMAKEEVKK
jgi:hypothetical protein